VLKVEIKNSIAEMVLDDGKVNAINIELMTQIMDELDEIEFSNANALIITGRGKSFSAGIDLVRMLKEGDDYRRQFIIDLEALFKKVYTFKKPVIAAINGHAVAGGCILAACCDYRIMADVKAKMGVTELKVGIPFPSVPMEVFRSIVHKGYLNEVVYMGQLYEPRGAMKRGLINEIVAQENLMERSRELAAELGAVPHQAFWLTKKSLILPVLEKIEKNEAEVGKDVVVYWDTEEVKNSMQSFMDSIAKK